jgi:hypothetical protein
MAHQYDRSEMHCFENEKHANINFSYQLQVSSFVNYTPLTEHFIDMFGGFYTKPIYFPKYIFSYATARVVYLSNYINALTMILNHRFDAKHFELLISKFIELFTLAGKYVTNNKETNLVTKKSIIDALKNKPYECDEVCRKFNYVDNDNKLFEAEYSFTSINY